MDLTNEEFTYPRPPASSLPQYPEMILAAIEALDEPNGSNKSAISQLIESSYGDLPAAHSTLLSHHLNRMKESGDLVMVKNNYMKPDPNAPPKRGRGRPPKEKGAGDVAAAPPTVPVYTGPSRGRGRPPKVRDPSDPDAEPASAKKAAYVPSGKPRGRPPKKAKVGGSASVAVAPIVVPVDGAPRGRGRPPKVKPNAESVGVGA